MERKLCGFCQWVMAQMFEKSDPLVHRSQGNIKVHKVFVYGTLKKGQPNYFHFDETDHGTAKRIGEAYSSTEYPLIVATKWNLPFLLHAPGKGKIVKGEIYHIDDEMLSWMDDFEGHPEVYERMNIKVIPAEVKGQNSASEDSKEVECEAYFLRKFPEGLLATKSLSSYDATEDKDRIYSVENDPDFNGPDSIFADLYQECASPTLPSK